jgi:RNA polymerase sigma-70 factor (ECF subfamily)
MTDDRLAEVVSATSARLYRLALRMTGSPAEAEDILQETYLRAHLALADGLFEARATLTTWLYRVAVNACLDVLRQRRRRRAFLGVFRPAAVEPLEHTEARTALAQTAALISMLPPDQAGALVLTQVEGLSNAEAAAALGCSEGAIEQRLIRARAALRRRGEP